MTGGNGLPLELVEKSIDRLDELLQSWHDRACDTLREGTCWCCCIECSENEVTATIRNLHQEFVYEKARREDAKCASDSPAPGTDAPTPNTDS